MCLSRVLLDLMCVLLSTYTVSAIAALTDNINSLNIPFDFTGLYKLYRD